MLKIGLSPSGGNTLSLLLSERFINGRPHNTYTAKTCASSSEKTVLSANSLNSLLNGLDTRSDKEGCSGEIQASSVESQDPGRQETGETPFEAASEAAGRETSKEASNPASKGTS